MDIKKYLFLLIFVFIFGVSSIVGMYHIIRGNVDKLMQNAREESKKIEFLINIEKNILLIKGDLFEMFASSKNNISALKIKNTIKSRIEILKEELKSMKGVCKELNLKFLKDKILSLERDLETLYKLVLLRNEYQFRRDVKLVDVAFKIREENYKYYLLFDELINYLENLIKKEKSYLKSIKHNIEIRRSFYKKFIDIVSFVVVVITILLGFLIAKRIALINQELIRRLYIDPLTGLKNRISLIDDLKNSPKRVLILMDINSFRLINEIYGTEFGNKVLQVVASYLKGLGVDVYRVGADEFVILLNDTSKDKLEKLIKKIAQDLESVEVEGIELNIDISVGVAIDEVNPLESATIALDLAKSEKVLFKTYDKKISLREDLENIMYWKSEIYKAIKDDRVVPVFQPIVDKNGEVVEYESLIRLRVNNELVSPYKFLKISMKTNQYHLLSKIMVDKTFKFFSKREDSFSINLSYLDILNRNFWDYLEKKIIEYGVKGRVIFEIVESEEIEDFKEVINFLDHFREFDIKVAIDDFGSGYSNFENIIQIKPDFLKIDGSLVKRIDEDKESLELVKAIVFFAKELNIKTIAEFVKNKEVFEILKSIGVDYYQGYYFSPPKEKI